MIIVWIGFIIYLIGFVNLIAFIIFNTYVEIKYNNAELEPKRIFIALFYLIIYPLVLIYDCLFPIVEDEWYFWKEKLKEKRRAKGRWM